VGSASPLIMMVLMFVVFYFLLIRPQVKRQKAHQAMLQALKKGDMIITRGGLIGRISGVSDRVLTIELQEKVRVRILRSHLEGKFEEAPAAGAGSQESKAA
jgi:preprotein translocase subunit YajC